MSKAATDLCACGKTKRARAKLCRECFERPRETYTCEHCGRAYIASQRNRPSTKHFCCRDCMYQYRRAHANPGAKNRKTEWRVCIYCGTEFESKRGRALYCSRSCAGKNVPQESRDGAATKLRTKVERVCEGCGTAFTCKPSQIAQGKGRYCSRACAPSQRRNRRSVVVKRAGSICPTYGLEFRQKEQRARKQKYCSRSCSMKATAARLGRCGDKNPNYRGDAAVTTGRHLWQNREGAAWRRDCRRRDNYTCRICGKPHDKHSRGLHVHHIAPFADYEALRSEEENGATLCRDCHFWLHSNDGEPWRAAWEEETLRKLAHLLPREAVAG